MTSQMEWFFSAIGHLSFALSAAGYITADIVRLRILAVCSIVLGIVFNATLATGPLWIAIFWLCIFLVANIWRLVAGYFAKRDVGLADLDGSLRNRVFPSMCAKDWRELIGGAPVEEYRRGDLIPTGGLGVVVEGVVSMAARDGSAERVGIWGAAELLNGAGHPDAQGPLMAAADRVAVARLPIDRVRALARENSRLNAAILDGFVRAAFAHRAGA